MTTSDENQRWQRFYRAVEGRSPRQLFLDALAAFEADGFTQPGARAVDLGCGDGTETRALLAGGWHVLAIDAQQAAIDRVLDGLPSGEKARLETQVAPYKDAVLPAADFIYAGLSLPFCPPGDFLAVWLKVVAALRPGARFAGHFFGERDGWSGDPAMTTLTAADVPRLFDGFRIEKLDETEEDRPTALGDPKHWHVFEVIARRV